MTEVGRVLSHDAVTISERIELVVILATTNIEGP